MIHRRVGVAQQRWHVFAIVGEYADADARRDVQQTFVDQLRRRNRFEHFLRDARRTFDVGQRRNDDDELVAAEPRDRLCLAQQVHEALGNPCQQLVSGIVTESVVDQFEAVEIEKEHCRVLAVASGFGDCLADAVLEQGAVRQSGQGIVVSKEMDMLFGALALADVIEAAGIVRHRAVGAPHRGDRQPRRIHFAVLAAIPHLAMPQAMLGDARPHLAPSAVVLAPGGKQSGGLADDLVPRVAGDEGQRRVRRNDALVGIGDADRRCARRKNRRSQALCLIGAPLVDDSPDVLADQARGLDIAPAVGLGLVADAEQHAPQTSLNDRYADQPLKAGDCRRMRAVVPRLASLVEQRRALPQGLGPEAGQIERTERVGGRCRGTVVALMRPTDRLGRCLIGKHEIQEGNSAACQLLDDCQPVLDEGAFVHVLGNFWQFKHCQGALGLLSQQRRRLPPGFVDTLALGHVGQDAMGARLTLSGSMDAPIDHDVDGSAILVPEVEGQLVDSPRIDEARKTLFQYGQGACFDELAERLANDLVAAVTEQAQPGVVDFNQAATGDVHRLVGERCVAEEGVIVCLGGGQRGLALKNGIGHAAHALRQIRQFGGA